MSDENTDEKQIQPEETNDPQKTSDEIKVELKPVAKPKLPIELRLNNEMYDLFDDLLKTGVLLGVAALIQKLLLKDMRMSSRKIIETYAITICGFAVYHLVIRGHILNIKRK